MKKIMFLLLIATGIFAQNLSITKVATIDATWSEPSKDLYETCVKGRAYYVIEAGYRSGLATVWEEYDHPVLGKIDRPKRCGKGIK